MPPCRHISVAPRCQASAVRRAISPWSRSYGRPRRCVGELALGEGAEAATEVADVGVVDVAVDDVADALAIDLAAQRIGALAHLRHLAAARGEQAHDLGLVQRVAVPGAAKDRPELRAARGMRGRCRRIAARAGEPAVLAGPTFGVADGRARACAWPAPASARAPGRSADRSQGARPAPCPPPPSRAAAPRAAARALRG